MILRAIPVLVLAALTACAGTDVKQSLGLKKKAPDEFMVLSQPPLSMPPDFSLRPPISEEEEKESTIRREAEETLFSSENSAVSGNVSKGEAVLLNQARAGKAADNIREVIAQENEAIEAPLSAEPVEERSFFGRLADSVNFRSEPLVDAAKEEERIKKNQQEGKPITEGDVPTRKDPDKGILNQIIQ